MGENDKPILFRYRITDKLRFLKPLGKRKSISYTTCRPTEMLDIFLIEAKIGCPTE